MPTLNNFETPFRGASKNFFGEVERLFGTAKSREQERDFQGQLDVLTSPGSTPEQRQRANIRVAAMNPQAAQVINETLERGDKLEIRKRLSEADDALRLVGLVKQGKTINDKREIMQQIAEGRLAGKKDVSRVMELIATPEAELNVELLRIESLANDTKTLLNPKESGLGPFGKPAIKDFTPESIQTFLTTKNPADLKAVGKGLSPQILSAVLPFTLGGVDFDDPNAVIQALAKTQAIGRALEGKGNGPSIPVPTTPQPQPEQPEEKGLIEKGVEFAKETASSLLAKLSDLTEQGINAALGMEDKTKRNKMIAELIRKGFRVELRRGQVQVNGQPLKAFMESQGLNQSSAGKSGGGFEVVDPAEVERDTNKPTFVDENGLIYTPDSSQPNGKRFFKNEKGQRLKARRF